MKGYWVLTEDDPDITSWDELKQPEEDDYPPKRSPVALGKEHALRQMRPFVVECLRRLGKDPKYCELCKTRFNHKLTIHHKKYEGATVYDLCYACQRCQNQPENKYLA